MTITWVFGTNKYYISEMFGPHGLSMIIFKMSAVTDSETPKIGITITVLLIVTILQYLPLDICFMGEES